jgi:hypothetical protein
MLKLTDVIVNGISLVMKWNTPAVSHAQTKFAILKSKKWGEATKAFEVLEKKFRGLSLPKDTGTICGPCGVDEK